MPLTEEDNSVTGGILSLFNGIYNLDYACMGFIALSPGPPVFSMLHAENMDGPGDEAMGLTEWS